MTTTQVPSVVSPVLAPVCAVDQSAQFETAFEHIVRHGTVFASVKKLLKPGSPTDDVLQLTREMFQQEPELELFCDPEYPEHQCLVVSVNATGEIPELIDRQLKWHEKVSQRLPSSLGRLSLSLNPSR